MHPALPRYISLMVTHYPETPIGSFSLAQLRLMSRAGVHPRGYTLHAFASTTKATAELRQRWGFPVEIADDITLRTHYDRIIATATKNDRIILDVALSHYEAVPGTDINFVSSIHLAKIMTTEAPEPHLVQVDPKYTIHRADRGQAVIHYLDNVTWNCPRFKITNPIAGTFTTVDTDLPQIRFVMDPERPITEGTRRVH